MPIQKTSILTKQRVATRTIVTVALAVFGVAALAAAGTFFTRNAYRSAYYGNNQAYASAITVTSPNGGEKWGYGEKWAICTQNSITWTSRNVDTVTIALTKGGKYVKNLIWNLESNGSASWTPDNSLTPGTDYKIRITVPGTGVYDESDRYFSIYDANDTISPSAPTNISVKRDAQFPSSHKLLFEYTLPSDSDYYCINIYRSAVSGQIGDLVLDCVSRGKPGSKTGYNPFEDTFVAKRDTGTVYYTIRAVDVAGNESTNTDQHSYSW